MQSTNNSNSHNTTSVANEYVVDKLIEQSKESERNRIARYDHERTLKDERLQRDIRKSEVSRKIESLEVNSRKLTQALDDYDNIKAAHDRMIDRIEAKDTEIARLQEAYKERADIIKEIYKICTETKIDCGGWDMAGQVNQVITTLQATIKSREAEANSYRDLYNELKQKALKDFDIGRDVYKAYQESRKQYKRLEACVIKNNRKGSGAIMDIMTEHHDNEKKLAKKKEGK